MDQIRGFTSTTTFHGLSLIPNSNSKCSRIFWLLILLGAVAIFVSQFVSAIQEYTDAPVAIEVARVRNTTLALPVVVICPVRGLNVAAMVNDDLSKCLIDKIMNDYGSTKAWQFMTNATSCNSTAMDRELVSFMQQNNMTDFKDFILRYALRISDFIYNIHTPKNNNFNSTTLSTNPTLIFGGFDAGICWTFTTGEAVNWPGLAGGLSIYLQLPPRTNYDLQHSDGWMIGVSQKVFDSPPNAYVRLRPNSMVDIDLTLAKVDRLQAYTWPKSGDLCDNNPTHVSSDDCFVAMFLKAVLLSCGCLHYKDPMPFPLNLSQPTCTPFQFDKCTATNSQKLFTLTNSLQVNCKPVCSEKIYLMSNTYGGLDPSFVRNTFSIPSTHAYESVTLTTVVSNLGGQLGLWLGASMISVIHLFSWVPHWIGSCVSGFKKKKMKSQALPAHLYK